MPSIQTTPSRVLALDPGKARTGCAVSDELGVLASPRPPIDGSDRLRLVAAVVELVRSEAIGRILVGLPLELGGSRGPAARKALDLAQRLADATGLEVELVDERLSTVEAGRRLDEAGVSRGAARVQRIDGAAACVLLQSWLDARSTARR